MATNRDTLFSAFKTYWRVYGGWRQLLVSPYLWLSGLFWALCKPLWFDQRDTGFEWSEHALSILPSMVSFSLGALAIFLAFSNADFLKILRQKGNQHSYLMRVTTAFFHFILVQFIALLSTILLTAYPVVAISAVAFWLFVYAIAAGVAAAAALLDMAEILNAAGKLDD